MAASNTPKLTRRQFVGLLGLGAGGVLISGCGAGQTSAPSTVRRETIGVIGFLSGGALLWGIDQQQAVQMWVNEVNEKGGLAIGGETVKFDIAAYDDLSTTAGGLDATQKAISKDNCKVIFGPILSSGTIAVKDLVNSAKVLQLSPCTSAEVHAAEYPYQFVFYQAGYEKAYTIRAYLDEVHPEVKKIVFIPPADETKYEIDIVTSVVPGTTREVVDTILYDRGTTDFYPVLQNAMSKNPDLILLDSNPPADCFNIAKQARELGFQGLMGATAGGLDMEAFYSVAGDAGLGFFNTTLPSGSFAPAEYQQFVDRFTKQYSRYDTWAGTIYVMCQVLEQAMVEADSTDPTALKDVLVAGTKFNTVIGPVYFGGQDVYGRNSHLIFKVGVGVLRKSPDGKGMEVCEGAYETVYSKT